MSWIRLMVRGGITSYQALFGWLSPWVLVPTFVVVPIVQILFFTLVGRSAGVGSARFYLVGNAVEYCSVPCLFAMSNVIGDERFGQTLGLILISPARRLPLFLGRTLPVVLNGFAVTGVAMAAGAAILGVGVPADRIPGLALVVAVSAFSCTGLGLVTGAIGLRVRDTAVLPNILVGTLLLFCGVDVRLARLPHWMAAIAHWLPLTHGIAAARDVFDGGSLASAGGLLGREVALGVGYLALGLVGLFVFERESRRLATLERY